MKIETQISLDKFRVREYQWKFANSFEKEEFTKYLIVYPRRCLSGDSHIIMSNGSYKLLKDIQVGDLILSWDGDAFVTDRVVNKWETEPKKTVKVMTSKQPDLICSTDHRFAYIHDSLDAVPKWKGIKDISKRYQLLTYAGMGFGPVNNPDLAEFLGYMHADGYVSDYQQPKFTNINNEILKRVEELAKDLFEVSVIWRKKGNGYDLGFSNGTRGGGTFINPIKQLFREDNKDHGKSNRRLHSKIWTFDKESTLRFIAALISADGSMYIAKHGFTQKSEKENKIIPAAAEISISCGSNKDYAHDLYWLLRKFGILPQRLQLDKASNWKIRISRAQDIKILLTYPVYGKCDRQQELIDYISQYNKALTVFKGCNRFGFKTEEASVETLYDIETEHNHNFVANGYVVHNSGKDYIAFNLILRRALKRIGSYFYCLPTFKQARLVIWDSITMDGKRFLDCIPKELVKRMNSQEMIIELINGSIIRMIGSDTYDTSLVGTNPVCVIFSEFALADDRAYKYVRPILNANGGSVVLLSTPRGHNFFYDLYQIAKNAPQEWYCEKLTVDDTQHIPIESIKRDIHNGEMSEELAKQEYWTDFSMGIEGSYYGRYVDKMRIEGRIGDVPWEPVYPVHVAFDLGMRDSTALVFFQVIGTVIHIIDCYENHSEGLEHYAKYLHSKEYRYGTLIAPHDIQVRELGTGMSRLEKAHQMGLPFVVAPNLSVMDGIEAVRSTLPRAWIDEKNCKPLIKALENYRKEFDNLRKVYYDRPVHDSHSNFADSVRYAFISMGKLGKESTPEEIDKRYKEVLYGPQNNLPPIFND